MPQTSLDQSEFSFRTREASWTRLKQNPNHPHNVLIIGGGIVGAGLIRELTLCGIPDVFLAEKNDFASGTSGASSKLIHAGIRYLEHVWVHLKAGRLPSAVRSLLYVYNASRERKVLGKIAPPLVKPKVIHLVLSRSDARSAASLVAGVWLYYLIQLLQGQFFAPPSVTLRRTSLRRLDPHLNAAEIKAAFTFWDSETDDARLVIENLQSAAARGAHPLNYVEVVSMEQGPDAVRVALRNRQSNEELTAAFKSVINASGPWIDEVKRRQKGGSPGALMIDRVAGGHLDVYPRLTDHSFYFTAADGRLVFLLKRNEDGLVYTRVGTTERVLAPDEPSDRVKISREETEYLKQLVGQYFPDKPINERNLIRADAGIRPLKAQSASSAFHKSREHDVVREGRIVHVVGVKLTDYRLVAREISSTMPWAEWGIAKTSEASDIATLRAQPEGPLYAEATITEVVAKTMPLHWNDYVMRRRGLEPLLLSRTNPAVFKRRFEEFAEAMGWDEKTKTKEWDFCGDDLPKK